MHIPQIHTPGLTDNFSRTISYLRLSVTDRCNLRCMYCMPCTTEEGNEHLPIIKFLDHNDLLSYEEMLRIVRVAVSIGMSKLRLTGGEPFVRRGIIDFITELTNIEGLQQTRITTNGVLLKKNVDRLSQVGVRHLNISLDTLIREKFLSITGRDYFQDVVDGIEAACEAGFFIKLNVVAMKGVNDDEFAQFAALAIEKNIQVRFIEFMPVGLGSSWQKERYISSRDIRKLYLQDYAMTPEQANLIDGPARVYTIRDKEGRSGKLGFISPISHHFCNRCNRLRLTSEGRLRACLLRDIETDLRAVLRRGCTDEEIEAAIRETIRLKPMNHGIDIDAKVTDDPACSGQMSRIGG